MKKITTIAICFLIYYSLSGQTLQLDSTFNANDVGLDYGSGFKLWSSDYKVSCSLVQPDGKIILGGSYDIYNGVSYRAYSGGRPFRINSDGTIDPSFNLNVSTQSTLDTYAMALQPDGKILLVGNFSFYVGMTSYGGQVIRLNSDGTVDNSFLSNGYFPGSSVSDCALQPDGKIIVVGKFTSVQGNPSNSILRLNSDGSIDNTFNPGGIGPRFGYEAGSTYTNSVAKILLQPDGKIMIVGNFGTYNGVVRKNIARLNADGTLDLTFNPGNGFKELEITNYPPQIKSLALQPDGKLLVGGNFYEYNGTTCNTMVRINTDGSIDTTFATGLGFRSTYDSPSGSGNDTQGRVLAIGVQNDGKIVVGGVFLSYNGNTCLCIARLNPDGTYDAAFNTGTGLFGVAANILNILSDGKILIAGQFSRYKNTIAKCIAKINSDGELDTSFNSPAGFDNLVKCSVVQSDGKILVGGAFTKYFGVEKRGILRLNSDGSLDTGFAIGKGIYSSAVAGEYNYFNSQEQLTVNSIALQSDNKILVAGCFNAFNGTTGKKCLIRLNSDGSIDNSFNFTMLNSTFPIKKILIQPDGKILICGNNNILITTIFRINADGSPDSSFTQSGSVGEINYFILKPDGKILINYGGGYYIKELNADGSLNSTFPLVHVSGSSSSPMNSFTLQSDNKILIAGEFSTVNGSGVPNLARLNPDGTLDFGFYLSGVSSNREIFSARQMPDGGYLISVYNQGNDATISLYKVNSSGNVELNFNNLLVEGGALSNNYYTEVYDMNPQPDGSVYIGGAFTSMGATGRNHFVKLQYNPLSTVDFTSSVDLKLYPNPTQNVLNIDVKADCEINEMQVFNVLGQSVIFTPNLSHKKTLDVTNLKNGTYFIRVNTNYGIVNKGFIKN